MFNQNSAPSALGSAVEAVMEFFEGLGGCIAIFAGAAAIIHYRNIVMPFWPNGALIVGNVIMLSSLVLAILVAGNCFAKHTRHIKSVLAQLAIVAPIIVITAFFIIAGGVAALKSL